MPLEGGGGEVLWQHKVNVTPINRAQTSETYEGLLVQTVPM